LVTFFDFRILQGSVATYYRRCGNPCGVYIDNFPTKQSMKEFWKLVHICQSYYQTSMGILSWYTVWIIIL